MSRLSRITRRIAYWNFALLLGGVCVSIAQGLSPKEEVETLDIVEITGTAEPEQKRDIPLPLPQIPLSPPASFQPDLRPAEVVGRLPEARQPRLLLDQTAQIKEMATPVKPLKTDHPPYPRLAREKGWEGVVLLHLNIDKQGNVVEAAVQESSGHALLDTQALQTIQHWKFQPAKNGNFPVSAVVNLPIKFDLRQ